MQCDSKTSWRKYNKKQKDEKYKFVKGKHIGKRYIYSYVLKFIFCDCCIATRKQLIPDVNVTQKRLNNCSAKKRNLKYAKGVQDYYQHSLPLNGVNEVYCCANKAQQWPVRIVDSGDWAVCRVAE